MIAEGAGVLILEAEHHARDRGATIIAEMCGLGMASGANEMVVPEIETSVEAMRRALEDAQLAPNDIDYVNAHGTGSVIEDPLETKAVKAAFGNHAYELSLSSTKSMHGHLLGAAAAIEAIACIKAMETGLMPPTLGLDESDPECDLDCVPHTARRKTMAYTMSNTSGLGGFSAAIVFGPPHERAAGARRVQRATWLK